MSQHSLGLVDEVISLVPVCQQVRGLLVVHADVVIRKQAWEEVVDFPGDVQDVINAVGSRRDTLSCHGQHTGTGNPWNPAQQSCKVLPTALILNPLQPVTQEALLPPLTAKTSQVSTEGEVYFISFIASESV